MLTVGMDVNNNTKYFHKVSPGKSGTFNSASYPFLISKSKLVDIGNAIESIRKHIPTSFLGFFQKIIENKQGVRAVDLSDMLLHLVPTLFVPNLQSDTAKEAIASLSRGCAIALCWDQSSDLLQEMDSSFKTFFQYCNQHITTRGNLSCSVFTPVMHYLVHIHNIINALGPLNIYSCRSNERSILRFKTLMTSTQSSQA